MDHRPVAGLGTDRKQTRLRMRTISVSYSGTVLDHSIRRTRNSLRSPRYRRQRGRQDTRCVVCAHAAGRGSSPGRSRDLRRGGSGNLFETARPFHTGVRKAERIGLNRAPTLCAAKRGTAIPVLGGRHEDPIPRCSVVQGRTEERLYPGRAIRRESWLVAKGARGSMPDTERACAAGASVSRRAGKAGSAPQHRTISSCTSHRHVPCSFRTRAAATGGNVKSPDRLRRNVVLIVSGRPAR